MSTKPETIPAELRAQLHALQTRKVQALMAGRSTLAIAAELRELCAYIDARPWEKGNREPGEGEGWAI